MNRYEIKTYICKKLDFYVLEHKKSGNDATNIEQPMQKRARQTNIELLRVLAIFFIIFGHIKELFFEEIIASGIETQLNRLSLIGVCAVNVFILITGYFLIERTDIKFTRFFKILAETMFYSFAITLIFYVTGGCDIKDLLLSLDPLAPTKFSYWFVKCYLALVLLAPFISRLVLSLSKRQYKGLLLAMMLINCTFCPLFPFGNILSSGWSVWWFICVFLIGGYIKLHYECDKSHRINWALALLVSVSAYIVCSNISFIDGGYNSLLTTAMAVSVFCLARTIDIEKGGIVNFMAPNVFAAYLIQEQPLLKNFIYEYFRQTLPTETYRHLWFAFVLATAIIIASVLIDKVRVIVFDKTGIDNLVKNISETLLEKTRKICA